VAEEERGRTGMGQLVRMEGREAGRQEDGTKEGCGGVGRGGSWEWLVRQAGWREGGRHGKGVRKVGGGGQSRGEV